MANFEITDSCIGCSACTYACANEAIVPDGWQYKILDEKCVDCSNCAPMCTVMAIIDKRM